jgi:hypothetical protein
VQLENGWQIKDILAKVFLLGFIPASLKSNTSHSMLETAAIPCTGIGHPLQSHVRIIQKHAGQQKR